MVQSQKSAKQSELDAQYNEAKNKITKEVSLLSLFVSLSDCMFWSRSMFHSCLLTSLLTDKRVYVLSHNQQSLSPRFCSPFEGTAHRILVHVLCLRIKVLVLL